MPEAPNQLIEQTTRHAAHLERLKSHEVKAFREFLRKMERDVVSRLDGEITEYTQRRLNRKLTAIRGALSDRYGEYRTVWRKQIVDLAKYESDFEKRSLEKVVDYEFTLPSTDQLREAVFGNPLQVSGPDGGALLDDFYSEWSDREVRRVTNTIRMGYAQGDTTDQIVRNIRGTAPAKYTDGALALSNRAMQTMTRTAGLTTDLTMFLKRSLSKAMQHPCCP